MLLTRVRYEMLLAHEALTNQTFRFVARLRPDGCYAVPPLNAISPPSSRPSPLDLPCISPPVSPRSPLHLPRCRRSTRSSSWRATCSAANTAAPLAACTTTRSRCCLGGRRGCTRARTGPSPTARSSPARARKVGPTFAPGGAPRIDERRARVRCPGATYLDTCQVQPRARACAAPFAATQQDGHGDELPPVRGGSSLRVAPAKSAS